MHLTDPISSIPKTHSTTIKRFKKVGVETVADLVRYFPIRYADYSHTSHIGYIQPGETITAQGKVTSTKTRYIRRNFNMQEVMITDGTGEMKLIWFNQPYIVTNIAKVDTLLAVAGKAEKQGKKLVMKPMEYEQISMTNDPLSMSRSAHDDPEKMVVNWTLPVPREVGGIENFGTHTGKIVPIYSQRGGLSTRLIREKIDYALKNVDMSEIQEWLPENIVREIGLPPYAKALQQSHAPETMTIAQKARNRLAFDELFTLHLSNILIRREWQNIETAHKYVDDSRTKIDLQKFIQKLPFRLTDSQNTVWEHIRQDMVKEHPMNRFLQGDVGSGKTVVAAFASYFTHLNGLRTLFMCPTEILAQQHYATLKQLFEGTGVTVELITGSTKKKSLIDDPPHSTLLHLSSRAKSRDPSIPAESAGGRDDEVIVGVPTLKESDCTSRLLLLGFSTSITALTCGFPPSMMIRSGAGHRVFFRRLVITSFIMSKSLFGIVLSLNLRYSFLSTIPSVKTTILAVEFWKLRVELS